MAALDDTLDGRFHIVGVLFEYRGADTCLSCWAGIRDYPCPSVDPLIPCVPPRSFTKLAYMPANGALTSSFKVYEEENGATGLMEVTGLSIGFDDGSYFNVGNTVTAPLAHYWGPYDTSQEWILTVD